MYPQYPCYNKFKNLKISHRYTARLPKVNLKDLRTVVHYKF
ncbi:hypothetical protein JBW_03186 [Pelosinus fermentans JBW45]|uniref:Uncharacterized protein n=1 Tax=Pelosinus fermentans JBW45 TaxID=1192197 RepID=I9DEB3_9FIRM|nr:hypothetical protein JBW_03186 [Pelosinus fermentans JBW45]